MQTSPVSFCFLSNISLGLQTTGLCIPVTSFSMIRTVVSLNLYTLQDEQSLSQAISLLRPDSKAMEDQRIRPVWLLWQRNLPIRQLFCGRDEVSANLR